jgi:hypothetical protein
MWLTLSQSQLLQLLCLLALNSIVDFFAMYGYILRRINPKPHLITFDAQHGHGDLIPDHQGLADSSRQDQHGVALKVAMAF